MAGIEFGGRGKKINNLDDTILHCISLSQNMYNFLPKYMKKKSILAPVPHVTRWLAQTVLQHASLALIVFALLTLDYKFTISRANMIFMTSS